MYIQHDFCDLSYSSVAPITCNIISCATGGPLNQLNKLILQEKSDEDTISRRPVLPIYVRRHRSAPNPLFRSNSAARHRSSAQTLGAELLPSATCILIPSEQHMLDCASGDDNSETPACDYCSICLELVEGTDRIAFCSNPECSGGYFHSACISNYVENTIGMHLACCVALSFCSVLFSFHACARWQSWGMPSHKMSRLRNFCGLLTVERHCTEESQ